MRCPNFPVFDVGIAFVLIYSTPMIHNKARHGHHRGIEYNITAPGTKRATIVYAAKLGKVYRGEFSSSSVSATDSKFWQD